MSKTIIIVEKEGYKIGDCNIKFAINYIDEDLAYKCINKGADIQINNRSKIKLDYRIIKSIIDNKQNIYICVEQYATVALWIHDDNIIISVVEFDKETLLENGITPKIVRGIGKTSIVSIKELLSQAIKDKEKRATKVSAIVTEHNDDLAIIEYICWRYDKQLYIKTSGCIEQK